MSESVDSADLFANVASDVDQKWNDIAIQLKDRCDKSQIDCNIIEEDDYLFGKIKYINIKFPAGREKIEFNFGSIGEMRRILDTEFESFRLLQNFDGLINLKTGEIEVVIETVNRISERGAFGRMARFFSGARELGEEGVEFVINPLESGPAIRIGPASSAILALSPGLRGRVISLHIGPSTLRAHDEATSYVQRIGNSLFFQIDKVSDVPLRLRRRVRIRIRGAGSQRTSTDRRTLDYPRVEYDIPAISLYWYARSASGMPLLQYLAYYQCIEYYFPVYSSIEAQNRLRLILKDPGFRVDRDADVARLLSVVNQARSSGGRGDERSALQATLFSCIDQVSLRTFINLDPDRATFFSSKKQLLKLDRVPIEQAGEIRDNISDRIYDIRCQIVHTKQDGGRGGSMILPFSKEADALKHDIDLVRFVAQNVLVASGVSILDR